MTKRPFTTSGLLGRISVRLYLYLGLTMVGIGGLSTLVIIFAADTHRAARELYQDGFQGVQKSATIDLLLEQHGRLVEGMPLQMDRGALEVNDAKLDVIERRLQEVVAGSRIDQFINAHGLRVSAQLKSLFDAADDVKFFASEFAQDKASERASEYTRMAGELIRVTQQYRDFQMQRAEAASAAVAQATSALTIWAVLGGVLAALFVGPLGVATMHGALTRLKRITRTMTSIAQGDLSVSIPAQGDHDEVGEMARAVAVFKSQALQLRQQDEDLRDLNSRIDIALNNMTHGLCMFDKDGLLIICNNAYRDMYKLPHELTFQGTPQTEIRSHRAKCGTLSRRKRTDDAMSGVRFLEDGRVISVSRRPMPNGGWVAVHDDITVRHEAEAEIAHLARHDGLTSLPNRLSFREQLASVVSSGASCALHCLDLDHFKDVNDTLGHPIGDQLLKQVGARLAANMRAGDHVARLGGDEFAILQRNVAEATSCVTFATRLIAALSEPYQIEGRQINIGATIGFVLSLEQGADADQLFRQADLALYVAKANGRGEVCQYQSSMGDDFHKRVALERDLRQAIASSEFEVFYQPILHLSTGRVTGFEALVRWRSPQRGMVSPADFIPLAEQLGLIDALGEWVLRQAVKDAAQWPPHVSLAVNLSAQQLRGTRLVSVVADALTKSGLPANRLELEITETALLSDEAHVRETLGCLRKMGIRIALDDFGTGYSSLSYLRSFPFDKIKIDRSFVCDILVRPDCSAIIRTITSLAGTLGLRTTAEGIETREQMEAVTLAGCDEGQGYLFARPMPIGEVTNYLTAELIHDAA